VDLRARAHGSSMEGLCLIMRWDRRKFLSRSLVAGAAMRVDLPARANLGASIPGIGAEKDEAEETVVDFRYAPLRYQSTFCFPDDPVKSLVDNQGSLLYDFPENPLASIHQFATIVSFSLAGMTPQRQIRQWLEAPGVPIVHTRVEQATAVFELITFATHREEEGRVDNVLMEITPKQDDQYVAPRISILSCEKYSVKQKPDAVTAVLHDGVPFLYCIPLQPSSGSIVWQEDHDGYRLTPEAGRYLPPQPLRYFFRLPQSGAKEKEITVNGSPEILLSEVRAEWKRWRGFGREVAWSFPSREGEFLIACARNIQQAREKKDNRLVFEVGPTVYRGLWIVDGNFILEAARYLGFDREADEGLESEWRQQLPSGQIVAGGGGEHWKDTAIAIFTLVRACELKQDDAMLRQLAPEVRRAVDFLVQLRDEAQRGSSLNGRYGLLAPGFADGGLGGVREEFTNTLWTLAGLRALVIANERLQLPELSRAADFYRELRSAFEGAARQEMVRHPGGFDYLPMLMHDDPALREPDAFQRPRPQTAQWALSHTIFPGEVFTRDHPVVRGHLALMQACTREDVPAETGWLWHDAVWTYNAAFVAEVYLWAGLQRWARRTFTGFLNHASPLYTWREEQPLRTALYSEYWGDMPHNWASAECVRYLRHMLVLEEGQNLRLLEGMMAADVRQQEPFSLVRTPTRFGRISLTLEPEGKSGWRMSFRREGGKPPTTVELPARGPGRTASGAHEARPGERPAKVEGAAFRIQPEGRLLIDPLARCWTVRWE
jgi:hypothetical protein